MLEFMVLSQHLPGGTEENHKKKPVSGLKFEYKAGVLTN
jgi:hypothetical protein